MDKAVPNSECWVTQSEVQTGMVRTTGIAAREPRCGEAGGNQGVYWERAGEREGWARDSLRILYLNASSLLLRFCCFPKVLAVLPQHLVLSVGMRGDRIKRPWKKQCNRTLSTYHHRNSMI